MQALEPQVCIVPCSVSVWKASSSYPTPHPGDQLARERTESSRSPPQLLSVATCLACLCLAFPVDLVF